MLIKTEEMRMWHMLKSGGLDPDSPGVRERLRPVQEVVVGGRPYLLDPASGSVYKDVSGGSFPEPVGKWVQVSGRNACMRCRQSFTMFGRCVADRCYVQSRLNLEKLQPFAPTHGRDSMMSLI